MKTFNEYQQIDEARGDISTPTYVIMTTDQKYPYLRYGMLDVSNEPKKSCMHKSLASAQKQVAALEKGRVKTKAHNAEYGNTKPSYKSIETAQFHIYQTIYRFVE